MLSLFAVPGKSFKLINPFSSAVELKLKSWLCANVSYTGTFVAALMMDTYQEHLRIVEKR